MLAWDEGLQAFDRWRRLRGDVLASLGLDRDECPHRLLWESAALRLRRYGDGTAGQGPAVLIVPTPFKRHYIWDLTAESSVVRHALSRGLAVYLVEWKPPAPETTNLGLEHYAGRLLDACVDAIEAQEGASPLFLAAHSLGGTLATLYCTRRPQRIAGLALFDAPLHFRGVSPGFDTFRLLGQLTDALLPTRWRIPGSIYSLLAAGAAPRTFFAEPLQDFWASLTSAENQARYWRVTRWLLDEQALPRALFVDVVQRLFEQDRYMCGELELDGERLDPRELRVPLLVSHYPQSDIAPQAAVLAFFERAGSRNKQRLRYRGERGVHMQHAGMLVGRNAHRVVWPRVFDWMQRQAAA